MGMGYYRTELKAPLQSKLCFSFCLSSTLQKQCKDIFLNIYIQDQRCKFVLIESVIFRSGPRSVICDVING